MSSFQIPNQTDIQNHLGCCLMPYRSKSPIRIHGINNPFFSVVDANSIIQTNMHHLRHDLSTLGQRDFCWLCDMKCVNPVISINYQLIKQIMTDGPTAICSLEPLDFQKIDSQLSGKAICVDCTMKAFLTAYPIQTLEYMIKFRVPLIKGVTSNPKIMFNGDYVCLHTQSFVDYI